MNIIFEGNKLVEGYSIELINKEYYIRKTNDEISISINNFQCITEYTAIQDGDYIEIKKGNLIFKGVATKGKEDYADIEVASANQILPYIIHEVRTYPKHTAILGILGGYNKDENWLYNNYGLFWVYIWSEAWTYWTDFKYGNEEVSEEFCPLIKQTQQKRLENIKGLDKSETIDFFKKLVQERKYALISLDMYYVIGWKDELNRNVRHQSIIYGYNDKKKVFYIADFFENNYGVMEIDYERFYNAVTSGAGLTTDSIEYKYNPQLEIYEFVDKEYDIDMERIKSFVNDFITSKDITTDNFLNLYEHRNALYGFEAMAQIEEYLNSSIYQNRQLDLKVLHIVRIYNEVMAKRLEFLLKKGLIKEDEELIKARDLCKTIVRKLKQINLLSLKYDCTLSRGTGEKVISLYNEIVDTEIELLSSVNTLLGNDKTNVEQREQAFSQFDFANKKYDEMCTDEHGMNYDYITALDMEVKDVFLDTNENKKLKKIVKRHAKGKKTYTLKKFYNVFPLEIEERAFIKEGKIVEKQDLISDIYIYYWQDDNVSCIEYLDDNKTINWLCFDYETDKIVRYWIARNAEGGYTLLGVKIATVKDDKVQNIYGYRNWWNNVKLNYYTYEYENDKLVKSKYYITNDEQLPLKYWINDNWCRTLNYYYDENDELKQIIREENGEKKTVFSNIIMDEKAVEDKVFDAINYLVDKGSSNIVIKYVTKENKIYISDDKEEKEISFFEGLIVEEQEVWRICYLIALAAYKVQNRKVNYSYFIDGKDVTDNKRYVDLLR